MRFPFIAILTILTVLIAVTYISCNKDDSKSTTRVKCVTCANGGSCINDTCRCPSGYEGPACQTLSRQKYMGTWMVDEKGSTATSLSQYSLNIGTNSSSSAINAVTIYDLYNYGFTTFNYISAVITADSIFIPSQQFGTQVIVGKGYIHASAAFGANGAITMRYMVTDLNTGITDDFGYNSALDSPSVWTR